MSFRNGALSSDIEALERQEEKGEEKKSKGCRDRMGLLVIFTC